jgi:hypothetical protein
MCWFSAEYANHVDEAKAGERLGVKSMHWHANWIVRETELDTPMPCPICLRDRTTVLFRVTEKQQAKLHLESEAKAVFKMLKYPKRDVFEFSNGKQVSLTDLPAGLIMDVLVVPGLEHLSDILENERMDENVGPKETLLTRLLAHFHISGKSVQPSRSAADQRSQLAVR